MTEIILPRLDEDYEESSIVFWHKQVGDSVQKGDVLVEVQTEKAVTEIEAEADGVLEEIVVQRGEVASVGDVLGIIVPSSEQASVEEVSSSSVSVEEPAVNEREKRSFVRVSPRLRKLAKEFQVDLNELAARMDGKITEQAIRNFADQDKSVQGEKLSGIRKTIAGRMKNSLQNSAQLTETAYADVTELASLRENHEKKMSWNSWILYAVIQAIKAHDYMNGIYENEVWKQSEQIHLGVATDTEAGLFVPVVENATQYSLEQLDQMIADLVQAVQNKNLDAKKLSGSTFTVTNLGAFGIHFFTPIINPPEVAILGLGAIEKYLVLDDEQVIERMRIPLSLTFDHQVIDGAPAARFLQTLITFLENPDKMT